MRACVARVPTNARLVLLEWRPRRIWPKPLANLQKLCQTESSKANSTPPPHFGANLALAG